MNFLDKLERKFGRFAIHNLAKYLIILYVAGAFLNLISGGTIYSEFLALNPYMILHGEIWRLLTFLIATPTTNLIFLIFVLLFYYNICQELEYYWGDFRFNLYILVGALGTIAASFILYFVYRSPYINMNTYYLNLSLFLAYAASFPETTFYLYGLIPIKAKWMGILDAVVLLYSFFTGGIVTKVSIVIAMLNFLLFFLGTRNYHKYSPKQVKRRKTYIKEVRTSTSGTRHRCHVCGRTELDDPNLEFRFCSKCEGNYEYCQDHLYTHEHVKSGGPTVIK
jgi:hypothetical protein